MEYNDNKLLEIKQIINNKTEYCLNTLSSYKVQNYLLLRLPAYS